MLTYAFDGYQVFGYCLLFFGSMLILSRRFSRIDTFWLSSVTVFGFEIGWEYMVNWIALYTQQLIVSSLVLKYVFMFAPMALWLYYCWSFGKRPLLALVPLAMLLEVLIVFYPNPFGVLSYPVPVTRLVWVAVFMINVVCWRSK